MNFLLSDEKEISEEDFNVRQTLYNEFMDLPENFVSKMRHLQPQVGCFNNCSFCSKFSVCKSEYWSLASLKNIISALKYTSKRYTDDVDGKERWKPPGQPRHNGQRPVHGGRR